MTGKRKPSKPETKATNDGAPRTLQVKVARTSGEGAARQIDGWDGAEVRIGELCIADYGRIFKALHPVRDSIRSEGDLWGLIMLSPEAFFEATGVAIRWPAERVAALDPADFLAVVFQVIEWHRPLWERTSITIAEALTKLVAERKNQ